MSKNHRHPMLHPLASNSTEPQFAHDCETCRLLVSYEGKSDVYACSGGILIRHSDDGPDYRYMDYDTLVNCILTGSLFEDYKYPLSLLVQYGYVDVITTSNHKTKAI